MLAAVAASKSVEASKPHRPPLDARTWSTITGGHKTIGLLVGDDETFVAIQKFDGSIAEGKWIAKGVPVVASKIGPEPARTAILAALSPTPADRPSMGELIVAMCDAVSVLSIEAPLANSSLRHSFTSKPSRTVCQSSLISSASNFRSIDLGVPLSSAQAFDDQADASDGERFDRPAIDAPSDPGGSLMTHRQNLSAWYLDDAREAQPSDFPIGVIIHWTLSVRHCLGVSKVRSRLSRHAEATREIRQVQYKITRAIATILMKRATPATMGIGSSRRGIL